MSEFNDLDVGSSLKEVTLTSYPEVLGGVPTSKEALFIAREEKSGDRLHTLEKMLRVVKASRASLEGVPSLLGSVVTERFTPSDDLASIVVRGRNALIGSVVVGMNPTLTKLVRQARADDVSTVKREITTRIERLFGSLGDDAQDTGLSQILIGADGEFVDKVQFALGDAFAEVRPSDLSQLLQLLYRELVVFTRAGGRLAGDWGRLDFEDGRMILSISGDSIAAAVAEAGRKVEPMGVFKQG